MSIPLIEKAVARVLRAVKERERITIHGDYDCDGVLGTHILRSVLSSMGVQAHAYLPHRDEGYGLGSHAVHLFSRTGTDLLVTVDNGINARDAIHLARRLGIETIVVDHHRIQEANSVVARVLLRRACSSLRPRTVRRMEEWPYRTPSGWRQPVRSDRVHRGLCSPAKRSAHTREGSIAKFE